MSSALLDALERHARERGGEAAVREAGGRATTWRELRDAAVACAWRARRDPGGVTLVSAPNGAELLVAILGCLFAGERVLPVSPELRPSELADLAARAGVSRAAVAERARRAPAAPPALPLLPLGELASGAGARTVARGLPCDGSILLPSSGTTGVPRIARRTLAALEAVGEGSRRAIGIGAGDEMLVAIPLHHSYGIDQAVLTAMLAGCALRIARRFEPTRLRAALRGGVSVFPATPFVFDALARTAREAVRLPRLRRAISAGSPLRRRVHERFERAFGVRIGQVYGATEFGSVTWNPPDDAGFDPESVGRPLPGVELRILDASDPRVERPLAAGSEGHVAVSAPSMLAEYVDEPGSPLRGGFFATGDLGRVDASGRLSLTGRLKLIADVGGLKVNPLEVEAALSRHPGVREVLVYATPFTETAERLRAVVVPEDGAEVDAEELRRFAQEQLLPYKVPRSFELRQELPRSATGKLLRREVEAAARPARGEAP